MLKSREILVVVIFSMVVRAFMEILLGTIENTNTYYLNLASSVLMYLMMAAILYVIQNQKDEKITQAINWRHFYSDYVFSFLIAISLLAFTLGENALEVLIVSNIDVNFAYSFWNFHEAPLIVTPFFSLKVLAYVLVTCIVAPVVEEFVFRVFLFKTLSRKFGLIGGIAIGSLLFTLFHFSSHYYLSTFIFSIVLYLVFIDRQSFISCCLIHGFYNLLAFTHQNYFDVHWTRSKNELSEFVFWIPQLAMLVISLSVLLYLLFFIRKPQV